MLRILVINYEFPPIGGGGGRVSEDLCRVLARRGHAVRVQTSGFSGLPKVETRDGYVIARNACFRKHADRCSIPEMVLYALVGIIPVLRAAITWKPDLVHVHFAVPSGALAFLVRLLTRVPYVLTAHLGDVPGGVPQQTDKVFRWIKPLTTPIWSHAAAVTAVSSYVRELALRSYSVPIRVIPNGIVLPKSAALAQKLYNPIRLVFAGRFIAQKNLLFLVKSLSRIRDLPWHLDLVGDGPLRQQIESALKDLSLTEKTRIWGWVEPDKADAILAESDILVLPSLSEGMPVVAVKALGFGLAIAGSRIPGLADVVNHGQNGLVFSPEKEEDLVSALRRLIENPGELLEMKKQSVRLSKAFDLEIVATEYEKILCAAVK